MIAWIKKKIELAKARIEEERGDTIVEVLVALTIGCLSLTLLAMAISTTSSLARESKTQLEDMYALEGALAEAVPTDDCRGQVEITLSNGTSVKLADEDFELSYCLPDDGQISQKPVVAYVIEGDE